MIFTTLFTSALASLVTAQTPAPYTDVRSGITFNTFQHSSGMFFGLALPANSTSSTDFIATMGGKGTGWSGVSLGSGMLNKLLIISWPNAKAVVSSFREATQYRSPSVVTGAFTQMPIANGTYVNSTHWTYTFLCSKCIQSDGTTFKITDTTASIGFAVNANAPAQKSNPASAVSKHMAQGQAVFDLNNAKSDKFEMWKAYAAAPRLTRSFSG
ncbi:CBD9-like protein [Decorospora gaudefroyi]|uniref:CBD9-like protein n=1 Tax=Decorospora gaudefroyi TaxID=184978 RepID=A0A6A5K5S8_9PLEO|nr:CBD9-like protein [Decorospora gaudefroyi]